MKDKRRVIYGPDFWEGGIYIYIYIYIGIYIHIVCVGVEYFINTLCRISRLVLFLSSNENIAASID
jgi:hypothetical protein